MHGTAVRIGPALWRWPRPRTLGAPRLGCANWRLRALPPRRGRRGRPARRRRCRQAPVGCLNRPFQTIKCHSAVVCRRVHESVVVHDGDDLSSHKGRRAEVFPPDGLKPRPIEERKLGAMVLRIVGIPRMDIAAAHVAAIVGSRAHRISAASHCTSAAFRRPPHFRKLCTTGL